MRQDLDKEMGKRNLSGMIVYGDTTLANPDLRYVVGGNLVRGGYYLRRHMQEPLLVTSSLDVGTARKLNRVHRISTYTELGLEKLARKHGQADAYPRLLTAILRNEGVHGRTGVYGRNDLSSGVRLADRLRKLGIKVVGESSPTLLESVRETKSSDEIRELRQVARRTAKVVDSVLSRLRNMKRKRNRFFLEGRPATVGAVKKLIASGLAANDLIAPEGTIFAIGACSADPHSPGNPGDSLKPGKPIVFDIFPQGESGYWFDLTRSFVLGRADVKVKHMFETVFEAQRESLDFLRDGVSGEAAMLTACRVIEKRRYRTVREVFDGRAKAVTSGFTHGLGHGVGLTIGERPYLTFQSKDPLRAGEVVTVEPGIYLPRYGGIRIEDTVVITSRGVTYLADIEKELELT
jgi:Xaa-Pro aminopeptidase